MTEEQFLKSYDATPYEKPSVTTDALIFTINERQKLEILLVKRDTQPQEGKWALPGSFIKIDETPEDAVKRALYEKTGLSNVYLEQLYTFGAVDRDPRMRIISISYMAFIPKENISLRGNDNIATFEIDMLQPEFRLKNEEHLINIPIHALAFDHEEQIRLAITRLQGKIEYTDIAFELLQNKKMFTIFELKRIYEAILNEPLDTGNFRRTFKKRYIDTGIVKETEIVSTKYSNKPSTTYEVCE